MRKLFMFLALVLGLVSCQNDPADFDVSLGNAQEVLINVSLPEGTRADSAEGAITNKIIESSEYTLRYIFQVYSEDDKTQKKEPVTKYSDESSVSFPVRLIPGRDYRFVVWADIVKESNKTDLHYNTTKFPAITLIDNSWVAMDETRDAYTVSEVITDFSGSQNYTLTLKRPFAKLRVITTDTDEWLGITPEKATVTYQTPHYDTFNALDSKASGVASNVTHTDFTIKDYETTNGKVLFTDYFFAENNIVRFNLSVMMSDNMTVNRSFSTDIPVKRNHLTTIAGQILTEGGNIEVRIEEGFDGEIEYPIIDRTEPANNEIWYTSTDGSVVNPRSNTDFGANIISNTYYGGRGIITFDGEVTKIGDTAFSNCSNLATIILPNSIHIIGDCAFQMCVNMQSILWKNITDIGYGAFNCCSSLSDLTIPDGAISIGYDAFSGCQNLVSITIPNSVTSIGENVFGHCMNLYEIKGKYASEDNRCLIVDGVLNSFARAGLDRYTIPDGVSTIGRSAFYASSLSFIIVPSGVERISFDAFRGSWFKTIYFDSTTPPTMEDFDASGVFGFNPDLKIFVPKESFELYRNADVWSDNSMYIHSADDATIYYTTTDDDIISPTRTYGLVQEIVSNTYSNGIGRMRFDDILPSIVEYMFHYNKKLSSIILPDKVTVVAHQAFSDCANLISVDFGESLITVDGFEFCTSLRELIFPDSLETIGDYAFRYTDIHSINMPDNLKLIGSWAFQGCQNLTSVTFDSNISTISDNAFFECNNLLQVYINQMIPPQITLDPWNTWHAFYGTNDNFSIYVPTESVDAYKSADGWNGYADNIIGYDFQ